MGKEWDFWAQTRYGNTWHCIRPKDINNYAMCGIGAKWMRISNNLTTERKCKTCLREIEKDIP